MQQDILETVALLVTLSVFAILAPTFTALYFHTRSPSLVCFEDEIILVQRCEKNNVFYTFRAVIENHRSYFGLETFFPTNRLAGFDFV